ncbi:flippase [Metabacillus arenae]|uniref:Flippase n=1 Tax=Metabacillus arenae TaxID=2771434 RepID=A0A926NJV1_9BACI|nr:flippase [Metabacillus arenae]MBD1382676.1 flippase [Metabacillus arenae]
MTSVTLLKKLNLNKKVYSNIGWLFFEKLFKMVLNFFVFAIIARYLGPENFGVLNFAIAFVFILTSLLDLGLSGLVVKEMVKNNKNTNLILGTTFYLKSLASVLGFLVLIVSLYFLETKEIMLVTLLVGISLLFKPLEVIDLYNQANIISKYTVFARNIALLLVSIIQLSLIFINAPLYYFAIAQTLEIILTVFLLLFYYKKSSVSMKWKFDIRIGLNLLKRSWPLIFSGIAAVLYLKVDQLMLQKMVGAKELGIYSAAARVSEVWYFIPNAIIASIFPQLVLLREDREKYNKKLQKLFDLMFILGLSLSVIVTIISPHIIRLLFGVEYLRSADILIIHIWASVFVFMRALLSKWLIIEELLIFSLLSHGLGVIVNVVLNTILIPNYGGMGAAFATVIAYSFSTFIFCFLSKNTMNVGFMMSKAFFTPVRYIFKMK